MILKIIKNAQARKIMHETAGEGMEAMCKRVANKGKELKKILQNGGGEALIKVLKNEPRTH